MLQGYLTQMPMAAVAREVIEAYGDARGWAMANPGRHRAVPAQGVAARAEDRARGESRIIARSTFPESRRAGRPRARRADEGQAAAAGRPHRDLDHRGVESAAPRVRRAASSTTSTCRADLVAQRARPRTTRSSREFADKGVTLHRVTQPALVLHVLQHGGSGRRRLHAGQDRAAPGDDHGLQHRGDDQASGGRARRCVATQPIPPGVAGHNPGFVARAPYDPAAAKALLDKFGYVDRDGDGWRDLPDGKPLTLVDGARRRRAATASATSCGRRT